MNKSSFPIHTEEILDKFTLLSLLLIISISAIANLPMTLGQDASNSYNYRFTVNEHGFTTVDVTFQSTENSGSSWVIVPKFSPWNNITVEGAITEFELAETQTYVGEDYYFYQVFVFSFVSVTSFQMKIQFNMTDGALIIEPRGVFLSPLIGFHPESVGLSQAEILFSSNYVVKTELIASSSGRSTYTVPDVNRVVFDLQDNVERLQVEFAPAADEPDWQQLDQSVFSFRTAKRYENYASEILALYQLVYADFTDLFNVTLENIEVQFFIPEFETLLSVGGFIPFTGQTLGEININIFFVRAVNGTIQAIALHELVHHFLWETGLSPDSFLWVHEGGAQYVSIETVDDLGYEGADIERTRLEQVASQLISQTGESFGYLQEWTPANPPADISRNYAASYYVMSRLAEEYGGLDFYRQFFRLIRGLEIQTNDELAFHLSLAANASVDLKLKLWGFDIRLLYNGSKISPDRIYEAEKALDGLNPVFLPYSLVAELFYQQALLRLERGDVNGANQFLDATILMANLAPVLTLLTLTAILAVIVYLLYKRSSRPRLEPPALPPLFEETAA
ncbi:hypothetical protein GWN65_00375 [Candidatus Bathyarchaeota archaeon]|nr:hypothetical protein [Candidatus Bathyarchaeota archaeon]NIV43384.1 hypothetical protein [Candidatus Bathyarchaeota archaeon]